MIGAVAVGWRAGGGCGGATAAPFSQPPARTPLHTHTHPHSAPSGPYQLSNAGGAHFRRGQLDAFEVGGASDVGRLRQVEVRHDGSGKRNGWHLAWVKVGGLWVGWVGGGGGGGGG